MSESRDRLRAYLEHWVGTQITSTLDADIKSVLDELDALKEAHVRMTAIYESRGRMVAAMRTLLDGCG